MEWVQRVESLRQAQADVRLTPTERAVFSLIWSFADPDGCDARPGIDLLAKCMSTAKHKVHDRTVRNAIKRLEGLGYVVKTADAVRRLRVANAYRVQMPDLLPGVEEFLARDQLRGNDDALARDQLRGNDDALARNSDGFSAQSGALYRAASRAPSSREDREGERGATALPPRPSVFCRKHPDGPDHDEACHQCQLVREDGKRRQREAEDRDRQARDAIRAAIDNCKNRCDAWGRLDDMTDCPEHLNFRVYEPDPS